MGCRKGAFKAIIAYSTIHMVSRIYVGNSTDSMDMPTTSRAFMLGSASLGLRRHRSPAAQGFILSANILYYVNKLRFILLSS